MTKRLGLTFVVAWLMMVCAPSAHPTQAQQMPKGSNTNSDAKQATDFLAKVAAYNTLRSDLQKNPPKLKETTDPVTIGAAEQSLAANIRAARLTARRGDIFTPATEAMLRRLVRPHVTGGTDAAANKAMIQDDAPGPKSVPFKVNGEYPQEAPLSTVPPDVLNALPPLPENLQYRFVGRHLILYCTAGNLIVDYMLYALP